MINVVPTQKLRTTAKVLVVMIFPEIQVYDFAPTKWEMYLYIIFHEQI